MKPEGSVVPVEKTLALIIEQPEAKKLGARAIAASPSAKSLAKEHSIDLSKMAGTGRRGLIIKEDVLSHISTVRGPGVSTEGVEGQVDIIPQSVKQSLENLEILIDFQ